MKLLYCCQDVSLLSLGKVCFIPNLANVILDFDHIFKVL